MYWYCLRPEMFTPSTPLLSSPPSSSPHCPPSSPFPFPPPPYPIPSPPSSFVYCPSLLGLCLLPPRPCRCMWSLYVGGWHTWDAWPQGWVWWETAPCGWEPAGARHCHGGMWSCTHHCSQWWECEWVCKCEGVCVRVCVWVCDEVWAS